MTDKEFKRLKRADLIEIIYRLQENEETYRERISELETQLGEKRTKLEKAGSIAEAAISLSNVFEAVPCCAEERNTHETESCYPMSRSGNRVSAGGLGVGVLQHVGIPKRAAIISGYSRSDTKPAGTDGVFGRSL